MKYCCRKKCNTILRSAIWGSLASCKTLRCDKINFSLNFVILSKELFSSPIMYSAKVVKLTSTLDVFTHNNEFTFLLFGWVDLVSLLFFAS